jgi:endoglucanase
MHQYLDGDSSGTSPSCVSATIGKERLESATAWLKKNHKKGFIGEFAGGVNSVCESAVEGMLSYMSENSDVWTGAEWWAAGPWWKSYMYNLEPADGPAYATYLPILEKYFVDGKAAPPAEVSSSTKTTAKTTTTVQTSTTTIADVKVTTTTKPNVQVPSATSSSTTTAAVETTTTAAVGKVPTTTAAPTTLVTATTNAQVSTCTPPASTENIAKQYYQCGGINWTGPTVCETGTTCVKQNPYYYQCISA